MRSFFALLVLSSPLYAASAHFDVQATYAAPARASEKGEILVSFLPKVPDVFVDEEPAPRLKLDPAQLVLVDRQPPPPDHVTAFDPETAKFRDPKVPVRFAVSLADKAPKGPQTVKATVVYFYCSKKEGWCRKGSEEISLQVNVP